MDLLLGELLDNIKYTKEKTINQFIQMLIILCLLLKNVCAILKTIQELLEAP